MTNDELKNKVIDKLMERKDIPEHTKELLVKLKDPDNFDNLAAAFILIAQMQPELRIHLINRLMVTR